MNALHEARAEIHSVHEEGTDGVQTTLSGPGGALLALLSIIVMNLMETIEKLKCTTEKKGEEPETGDTPKK